jgi:hypothetical protein
MLILLLIHAINAILSATRVGARDLQLMIALFAQIQRNTEISKAGSVLTVAL